MEEIEKYTAGGKRKGAGRPIKPDKKVPHCIKLRPDQLNWLRERKPNGSKIIETLVDGAMSRETKGD